MACSQDRNRRRKGSYVLHAATIALDTQREKERERESARAAAGNARVLMALGCFGESAPGLAEPSKFRLVAVSYNVTAEELFDLFGKFGPIRQIRQGIANNTKGTAFVVYEEVMDAKQACDKLNGFNFQNRYLVVLYHQPEKMARSREDLAERQENLERLKQQHGIE
ncbi:uncharacterized protein TRUGW13939_06055 [Talaromyces rugulosus]|uniref:RRM domain-containing protein n=1 Tax=Talaromyces rugulosus TaxID=121627 RepID=A0A7H8QY91_TALRU|nr:uncharacterized protein TRUGW13939_06055 [Talaromyces rugulosus]QKX58927.1 hypothetical protein TRUGW13939_06055 [Talaromyces rugulosus]